MDVDILQGITLMLLSIGNIAMWVAFQAHKHEGHDGRN